MATGITKRHSPHLPCREGGRCNCNAGWEASVFSKRDGKKIRKTFTREAEAKSWRADALAALDKGGLRAPKPTTVREAWEAWHAGAKAGTIRNRSGDRYKPSASAATTQSMSCACCPASAALGCRTSPDRRAGFVDRLLADGLAASTIQTHLPAAAGDLPPRARPW